MTVKRIEIKHADDVALAREAGREVAARLGLAPAMGACLEWAIREVARKMLDHSKAGACVILDQSDSDRILVRVTSDPEGPGIALSAKRNGNGKS